MRRLLLLERLNLPLVSDAILLEISQSCPNLTALHAQPLAQFVQVAGAPDDFLYQVASSSYAWSCLRVALPPVQPHVTDAGVVALANGCTRLVQLSLGGCVNVGPVGLRQLARKCGRLEVLRLARTAVDDTAVVAALFGSVSGPVIAAAARAAAASAAAASAAAACAAAARAAAASAAAASAAAACAAAAYAAAASAAAASAAAARAAAASAAAARVATASAVAGRASAASAAAASAVADNAAAASAAADSAAAARVIVDSAAVGSAAAAAANAGPTSAFDAPLQLQLPRLVLLDLSGCLGVTSTLLLALLDAAREVAGKSERRRDDGAAAMVEVDGECEEEKPSADEGVGHEKKGIKERGYYGLQDFRLRRLLVSPEVIAGDQWKGGKEGGREGMVGDGGDSGGMGSDANLRLAAREVRMLLPRLVVTARRTAEHVLPWDVFFGERDLELDGENDESWNAQSG
ncbi:unnamed protein product [Closterium sp. NIES-53]